MKRKLEEKLKGNIYGEGDYKDMAKGIVSGLVFALPHMFYNGIMRSSSFEEANILKFAESRKELTGQMIGTGLALAGYTSSVLYLVYSLKIN
jgi:hypothetical protein